MGKSVDPALIFSIDSKLFRGDPALVSQQIEQLGKLEGDDDGTPTQHHDEVETLTLLRSAPLPAHAHAHEHEHEHEHIHTTAPKDAHGRHHPHPPSHPEEPKATAATTTPPPSLDEPTLTAALSQLPKESVYRVKGFIRFAPAPPSSTPSPDIDSRPWWILNWAFGRWELVRAPPSPIEENGGDGDGDGVIRLTVMGERGEVRRYAEKLADALGAAVV